MHIPPESLDPKTLTKVIEEYVSREGTDYGSTTYTLDEKVNQVRQHLQKGLAVIFFDAKSQSVDIKSLNST